MRRKPATLAVVLVAGAATLASPSAAGAFGECVYDATSGTVTAVVPKDGALWLGVASGQIVWSAPALGASGPCGAATVTNTDRIAVGSRHNGDEFLRVDDPAAFAPGATPEATGRSEIEFDIDLQDGANELELVGSLGADVFRVGELGADVDADGDDDLAWQARRGSRLVRVFFDLGHGDDVVDASAAGRLLIIARGDFGDDRVIAPDASTVLQGGPGDDTLVGGSGNDDFVSEPFTDGSDTLLGGDGADTMSYRERIGRVRVRIDRVADDGAVGEHDFVSPDVEGVTGGAGDDLLIGSDGPNWLAGIAGDDDVRGRGGADSLHGDGNSEDDGADVVDGGPGPDTLQGGAGSDRLLGGLGDDTVVADDGEADVADGGAGADSATVDCGLDTVLEIESVTCPAVRGSQPPLYTLPLSARMFAT